MCFLGHFWDIITERSHCGREVSGQNLAHINTEKRPSVKAAFLRWDYVKHMVIGANVSHLFGLVKAQEEARKAQRGVWTP